MLECSEYVDASGCEWHVAESGTAANDVEQGNATCEVQQVAARDGMDKSLVDLRTQMV